MQKYNILYLAKYEFGDTLGVNLNLENILKKYKFYLNNKTKNIVVFLSENKNDQVLILRKFNNYQEKFFVEKKSELKEIDISDINICSIIPTDIINKKCN